MKLSLISPDGTQLVDIAWLEINTVIGNMVIKPQHAPLIALLAPNKPVHYGLVDGAVKTIMVPQGIAEITRVHAIILINTAV